MVNIDCHLIFEQYRNISNNLLLENVEKAIAIKDKYYPNLVYRNDPNHPGQLVDDERVKEIYQALADQQVAKTVYLNWIFLLMKNKVPRIWEDLETIAQNLKVFNAKSSRIAADGNPTQLFNQQTQELIYKKPQDLYDVVSNYIPADEKGERLLLKKGQYLSSKGEADKVYEDDNFVVYSPKTYNASKELGCLSNWCTRFPNMYEHYSNQGPLYIIFDKFKMGENLFGKALEGDENDDNRMIQFHLPSRQFKNIKDREVKGRKEFMNQLKGLYQTLYPNALNELREMVKSGKKRSDLSSDTKQSMYILPMDYREELDIPCDEIQEKIASELGVDCQEVEEADYGYEVNGEVYTVQSVEDATNQAVDSLVDSGLDDEWFIENILDGVYHWSDIYDEEDYQKYPVSTGKEAFNIDEPEQYEEIYRAIFEPRRIDELRDKNYSDEDILGGQYFNDLPYEKFIETLEDSYGSDPVRHFTENLGYDVSGLNFVDLNKHVRNWLENSPYEDRIGNAVSSYDGAAYYFDIDGEEMIMYRVE